MKKKGSITVFLALVLSVLLSLVATSIQSVQAAAAKVPVRQVSQSGSWFW